MGYEPSFSPWGVVQTCKTICPGVFEVTTPSHGGIMAKKQAASQIFSKSAQKIGFWERGCLCFEEDCDACVALRELMDRGLHTAPVNQYFGPGKYEACIDSNVQHFHPDYWKAREDGQTQIPKQIKMKEFER